jgi:hypothetical protein
LNFEANDILSSETICKSGAFEIGLAETSSVIMNGAGTGTCGGTGTETMEPFLSREGLAGEDAARDIAPSWGMVD